MRQSATMQPCTTTQPVTQHVQAETTNVVLLCDVMKASVFTYLLTSTGSVMHVG